MENKEEDEILCKPCQIFENSFCQVIGSKPEERDVCSDILVELIDGKINYEGFKEKLNNTFSKDKVKAALEYVSKVYPNKEKKE